MIAKHLTTGRLYEVEGIAHSTQRNPADDVCRCRVLSAHDGMPIGPSVWIAAHLFDFGVKSPDVLPEIARD